MLQVFIQCGVGGGCIERAEYSVNMRGKIDGEKSHSSGVGLRLFCWDGGLLPDKQAITGDYYKDFGDDVPVMQVLTGKMIRPDPDL